MSPSNLLLVVIALSFVGCSYAPKAIREVPPENVSLKGVLAVPTVPVNTRVRWGGTILSVENVQDVTTIEVLERELTRGGKPVEASVSQGRFLARIGRFLDPAVYADGRAITVVGVLGGSEQRTIGEHLQRLPVVSAETHHLWYRPAYPPRRYYSRYPYYDYPYYGFYPSFHLGLHFDHHRHIRSHFHGGAIRSGGNLFERMKNPDRKR